MQYHRVYSPLLPCRAYPSGDVVVLVLNAHTYDTTATLTSPSLAAAPRDVYWLSPPGKQHQRTQQVSASALSLTIECVPYATFRLSEHYWFKILVHVHNSIPHSLLL